MFFNGIMTSRERVTAAIKFKGPDRIPVDLWTLPAVYLKHGKRVDELLEKHPIDFVHSKWNPEEMEARFRTGKYEDEWGCIWENKREGYFGLVVRHPLEDYRMLRKFEPPFDDIRDIVKDDSSRGMRNVSSPNSYNYGRI